MNSALELLVHQIVEPMRQAQTQTRDQLGLLNGSLAELIRSGNANSEQLQDTLRRDVVRRVEHDTAATSPYTNTQISIANLDKAFKQLDPGIRSLVSDVTSELGRYIRQIAKHKQIIQRHEHSGKLHKKFDEESKTKWQFTKDYKRRVFTLSQRFRQMTFTLMM